MKDQSVVLILLVTVTAATASCRQPKAPLVKSDVALAACAVALAPAT
jgi:hypothetical protein